MTNKELGEEIEVIVKDLCKFGGRQDKYALEVVDEIKKRLEILEILKPHLKLQNIGTTPKYEIVLVMDENIIGFDRIKELLERC